jgi:hypothetical protein
VTAALLSRLSEPKQADAQCDLQDANGALASPLIALVAKLKSWKP